MIARTWHCTASNERAADYIEHFKLAVFPELRRLEGFIEASILQRNLNDAVELTVITVWESIEVISRFAGENVETAVVAPEAQAVLLSFDTTVTHHELMQFK
jgi:heme-degrading monooxygenase HmoA